MMCKLFFFLPSLFLPHPNKKKQHVCNLCFPSGWAWKSPFVVPNRGHDLDFFLILSPPLIFFVPAYVVPFSGAQLGSYTYTPSRFFPLCPKKKRRFCAFLRSNTSSLGGSLGVSLFYTRGSVRFGFSKTKMKSCAFFLSLLYPLADKSSCTLSTQSHLHPHWSPSNSGFSMLLDCILASTILSHKSRCAIDFGTIAGLSVFGGLLRLFSPSVMGFWSELGHPFCPSTYKNAVCERPPQKQHLFLVSYLNAHWTLHPLQHAFYSCHSPPTP